MYLTMLISGKVPCLNTELFRLSTSGIFNIACKPLYSLALLSVENGGPKEIRNNS
jgi:hypothetical protein